MVAFPAARLGRGGQWELLEADLLAADIHGLLKKVANGEQAAKGNYCYRRR